MVPAIAELAPLPKLFATQEEFMAGTKTMREAHDFCRVHEGHRYFGVLREGVTRYMVEVAKKEPTIRERMDRIKSEGIAPAPAAGPVPQKGIRREIWDAYDRLFAEKGEFTKADATHILLNYNNSTCGVVFGEWKRYHGHNFKMK